MRLELHPLARSDISRIVDEYKRAGGSDLAEDFYSELDLFLDKAASLKGMQSENVIFAA
jgi:plasmid stabilization system protein ParE